MAKHNSITQEEIEYIINSEKTAKEIATVLHRHPTTIRNIALKYNKKLKRFVNRKYEINENIFEFNNITVDVAYLLGFIAADGCVSLHKTRNGGVLGIGLAVKDKNFLENIRNFFFPNLLITYNKSSNSCRLSVCSRKICDDLINIGITPRKSLTLQFPKLILDNKKLLPAFISGYFDGDGYVRQVYKHRFNHKYLCLEMSVLGTFNFLNTIKEEFNKIYGKNIGSLTYQKQSNIYRLTFSTKSAVEFAKWIYQDNLSIILQRKYIIYKSYQEFIDIRNAKKCLHN